MHPPQPLSNTFLEFPTVCFMLDVPWGWCSPFYRGPFSSTSSAAAAVVAHGSPGVVQPDLPAALEAIAAIYCL